MIFYGLHCWLLPEFTHIHQSYFTSNRLQYGLVAYRLINQINCVINDHLIATKIQKREHILWEIMFASCTCTRRRNTNHNNCSTYDKCFSRQCDTFRDLSMPLSPINIKAHVTPSCCLVSMFAKTGTAAWCPHMTNRCKTCLSLLSINTVL